MAVLGEHDQKGILLDPPCFCSGALLAATAQPGDRTRRCASVETALRSAHGSLAPSSSSGPLVLPLLASCTPQPAPCCTTHTFCLHPSLCARGGGPAPQRVRLFLHQWLQCPSPGPLLLTSCTPQPAPCCVAHTKACPQPPRTRRPNQQCSVKAAIGPFRPTVIPVSPTRLNFAPHAQLSARFVHA